MPSGSLSSSKNSQKHRANSPTLSCPKFLYETTYSMNGVVIDLQAEKVVANCGNPDCKWPIYHGDQVWKLGNKLFCNGGCLATELAKGELVRRELVKVAVNT